MCFRFIRDSSCEANTVNGPRSVIHAHLLLGMGDRVLPTHAPAGTSRPAKPRWWLCGEGAWSFFIDLFLPEGYPASVADDYAPFQAWDTVQQIMLYVNSVIATQAYFVFHGVGVAGYTGVDSAILERTREAVGTAIGLAWGSPDLTDFYKLHPAFFKFFAGFMEALGHLVEIAGGLAFAMRGRAIFDTPWILLFYGAPFINTLVSSTWTSSRYIILQHFAEDRRDRTDARPL